jgi:hypothetical protein
MHRDVLKEWGVPRHARDASDIVAARLSLACALNLNARDRGETDEPESKSESDRVYAAATELCHRHLGPTHPLTRRATGSAVITAATTTTTTTSTSTMPSTTTATTAATGAADNVDALFDRGTVATSSAVQEDALRADGDSDDALTAHDDAGGGGDDDDASGGGGGVDALTAHDAGGGGGGDDDARGGGGGVDGADAAAAAVVNVAAEGSDEGAADTAQCGINDDDLTAMIEEMIIEHEHATNAAVMIQSSFRGFQTRKM